MNEYLEEAPRGERGELQAERLAEHLDLKLEIQFEVLLLVELGQQVEDPRGPGAGRAQRGRPRRPCRDRGGSPTSVDAKAPLAGSSGLA